MQLVVTYVLSDVECGGETPYYIMPDGEKEYRCFDKCYYP